MGKVITDSERFVPTLSLDQRAAWLSAMIGGEGDVVERLPEHAEFTRISQNDGPIQDAIKLAVYLEGWRPSFSQLIETKCGRIGMCSPHFRAESMSVKSITHQPSWSVATTLGTWTMRQMASMPCLTGS